MAIAKETHEKPTLVTSREPVGPKTGADRNSVGDRALMDAVTIIAVAMAVLFLLVWSLRSHNV